MTSCHLNTESFKGAKPGDGYLNENFLCRKCGFLVAEHPLPVPAGSIPSIRMRDLLMDNRVPHGVEFTAVLEEKFNIKIPITRSKFVNDFPDVFQLGEAEYDVSIDSWLVHDLISDQSETAVVILDGMWQRLLSTIAYALILLDQHDASSQSRLRPDFTAMLNQVLVMKGEAKPTYIDIIDSEDDLTNKFHKAAYKIFPSGCSCIPAVLTCGTVINLYCIEYFGNTFSKRLIRQYMVKEMGGRVSFIVDIFKILRWIMSQSNPVEKFHLLPNVRRKTINGHHITLNCNGLLKEFNHNSLERIDFEVISAIYALQLPHVEHGITNHNSVTITRVGSQLKDVIHCRNNVTKRNILEQVKEGVLQLHANGFAHCDICVDNIFVDFTNDGGRVFLGDLEYCCLKDKPPPIGIKRGDSRAKTAEELDNFQLERLEEEIARM